MDILNADNYLHFEEVDIGETVESRRKAIEENYGKVSMLASSHERKIYYLGILREDRGVKKHYNDSFLLSGFKVSNEGTSYFYRFTIFFINTFS